VATTTAAAQLPTTDELREPQSLLLDADEAFGLAANRVLEALKAVGTAPLRCFLERRVQHLLSERRLPRRSYCVFRPMQ
jgi:hypothetical protein